MIAMPEREDLGTTASLPDKRICWGGTVPSSFQAKHLAEDGVGGLRIRGPTGAAYRDVQQAVVFNAIRDPPGGLDSPARRVPARSRKPGTIVGAAASGQVSPPKWLVIREIDQRVPRQISGSAMSSMPVVRVVYIGGRPVSGSVELPFANRRCSAGRAHAHEEVAVG